LGTAAVTVIYLLVNLAYLVGLGFDAARSSQAVAADVLALAWGERRAKVLSVAVMVSGVGCPNGMVLTRPPIYPELGADQRFFAPLCQWHPRLGTPVRSLVVQALLSIVMIIAVGIWWEGRNGFDTLVSWTAPVFWLFFLLTGLALFVLRFR